MRVEELLLDVGLLETKVMLPPTYKFGTVRIRNISNDLYPMYQLSIPYLMFTDKILKERTIYQIEHYTDVELNIPVHNYKILGTVTHPRNKKIYTIFLIQ